MTEDQALILALADTEGDYRARRIRGEWCVWSDAADHVVEFDGSIEEHVRRAIEYINERIK